MSRGTAQLFTLWTPVGDVTTDMGTLAVVEGSHRGEQFAHFQVGQLLIQGLVSSSDGLLKVS